CNQVDHHQRRLVARNEGRHLRQLPLGEGGDDHEYDQGQHEDTADQPPPPRTGRQGRQKEGTGIGAHGIVETHPSQTNTKVIVFYWNYASSTADRTTRQAAPERAIARNSRAPPPT